MKPTMKTLAAVGLTLAAGLTIPACGGITSDFCNERCSCEDCSDIGRDECVIDTDRDLEIASVYGCDDAYEARKQCEIKSYTCVDGRFLVTINDVDPCAVEAGDLNRCLDDGSGIR